jgi:mannose-1-phosphate guanylyltransferase
MAKHLVIMAGGIGSRFWPMSTPQCPKQFLDITGCGKTMIQQTFERYDGIIDINHVWVVTSKDYKDLVLAQLQGISPQHVLLEPCMRNTAPCIAYVSWKIYKEDPNALMVVAPSDHLVLNKDVFKNYIKKGFNFIGTREGIITMGMQPNEPNTGYGYIEQGEETIAGEGVYKLKSFREKPDLRTAIGYLQQGGFTWNSGMFMWSAEVIVNELRKHNPDIAAIMDRIAPALFSDKEQNVVNELFPQCPKISIDYAVMEKTDIAYVMPAEYGWSDLGTWGSLHALTPHDDNNNAVIGKGVKIIDSTDCMVRMPEDKRVVIQGLKDCIVAEHDNTLLICQLSEEQRIKEWHD